MTKIVLTPLSSTNLKRVVALLATEGDRQERSSGGFLVMCVKYICANEVGHCGMCTVLIYGTYRVCLSSSLIVILLTVVRYLVSRSLLLNTYIVVPIACPRSIHPSMGVFSGCRIIANCFNIVSDVQICV